MANKKRIDEMLRRRNLNNDHRDDQYAVLVKTSQRIGYKGYWSYFEYGYETLTSFKTTTEANKTLVEFANRFDVGAEGYKHEEPLERLREAATWCGFFMASEDEFRLNEKHEAAAEAHETSDVYLYDCIALTKILKGELSDRSKLYVHPPRYV